MTKAKAEDSIDVAGLFLDHIKQVLTKNGLALGLRPHGGYFEAATITRVTA